MFLSGFGCCGEIQSEPFRPFSRKNFKLIPNKIFYPVIKKALQDKIVKGKHIVRKLEDKQNFLLHLEKFSVNFDYICLFLSFFWTRVIMHSRGGSRIFLGGGALVSCSTSTPINHIVFFFAEYQLY